jgi:hypothetical protein
MGIKHHIVIKHHSGGAESVCFKGYRIFTLL